jgi:CubicO group peptidase (beta-lactamase class C family)
MNIAKTLEDAVAAGDLPGVAATAATDKGVIFTGGAGTISPDSVLSIASMTKAITGAAAMQLVEQGKLALDEPVGKLVPELGKRQVLDGFAADGQPRLKPASRPITLRQLLTHTSGLGYDTWNAGILKYCKATGTPAVGSCQNAALSTPLVFEPGERWEYSISIDWAGKMVEAASGLRLDRYLRENIFAPLGMADSGFRLDDALRARRPPIYSRTPDGVAAMEYSELPQEPEFHMGGGGLYSTIGDYLKFTRAILAGGGGILKPATVALMAKNAMGDVTCRPIKSQMPERSTDLDFVDGMKWGLSFMINPTAFPGRRSAGSLTWGGLYNSYFWIDPVKKVTGEFCPIAEGICPWKTTTSISW